MQPENPQESIRQSLSFTLVFFEIFPFIVPLSQCSHSVDISFSALPQLSWRALENVSFLPAHLSKFTCLVISIGIIQIDYILLLISNVLKFQQPSLISF